MKDIKPAIVNIGKFPSQAISVTDRKKASLTGVVKVDGATSAEIVVTTCLGKLVISGSELKISKFDEIDGNLSFTGNIDALKYVQTKPPLLKRIFK